MDILQGNIQAENGQITPTDMSTTTKLSSNPSQTARNSDKFHKFQLNPVTKRDLKEEKLQQETYFFYLLREFKNWFVGHIPIEVLRTLPGWWKYLIGFIAYGISLSLYGYYFALNFESFYYSAYISLQDSSGDCEPIPITLTNSFLADTSGHWQSAAHFTATKSLFLFEFSNFEATFNTQYEQMMNSYYFNGLQPFGKQMTSYNLAINIVAMNTFAFYYSLDDPHQNGSLINTDPPRSQSFQFSSTPLISYDRNYFGFSLGSPNGVCNLTHQTDYDATSGVLNADYIMQEIVANTDCWDQLSELVSSSRVFLNQQSLSIQLNVESFSVAFAINMGFQPFQNIISVSSEADYISFNNTEFSGMQYVDLRFPSMDPIYCLSSILTFSNRNDVSKLFTLCMILTGDTVFLPITNHLGNSVNSVEECNCQSGTGSTMNCNLFNFMLSVIIYPTSSRTIGSKISLDSVLHALKLYFKHNLNYEQLNQAAYPAMATTVLQELNRTATGQWTYENGKEFEFCKLSNETTNITCSLLTFFMIDKSGETISPNRYKLINGSCNNAVMVPYSTWQNLVLTPPISFYQPYYECYPTLLKSVLYAAGIGNSIASLTMWMLLCICLPIVYITFAFIRGIPPKPEYSKLMKSITLDTLATFLLRIQDYNYEGLNEKGFIVALAEELIEAVQYTDDVMEKGSVMDNHSSSMYSMLEAGDLHYDEDEANRNISQKNARRRNTMTSENGEASHLISQKNTKRRNTLTRNYTKGSSVVEAASDKKNETRRNTLTGDDTGETSGMPLFMRGFSIAGRQISKRSDTTFSPNATKGLTPKRSFRLGVDRIDGKYPRRVEMKKSATISGHKLGQKSLDEYEYQHSMIGREPLQEKKTGRKVNFSENDPDSLMEEEEDLEREHTINEFYEP